MYDGASVLNLFDPGLRIAVSPGEFHDYRMTSWDMRTYDLFIDGELVHEGVFSQAVAASRMAWGDAVVGAASLHRWDYLRLYTVPEPSGLALCGAVFLSLARQHPLPLL